MKSILDLAKQFGFKIDPKKVRGTIEYTALAKGEEIVFKYSGPPAERDFCREMMALDKFYTREEINIMSLRGKNRKFGHKRQNYSIAKYKGGVNCKHRWVAYTIIRDKNGDIKQTALIGNASGKMGEVASPSNNFWRYN